ncbi:MAG: DUF4169 family protein [Pseudomonadota bacterium]
MAEIVNLRQARKTKTRKDAAAKADANRAAFGRTRREKDATKDRAALAERLLDGAKRET